MRSSAASGSVRATGGLLSADFLERLASGDSGLAGMEPESYGLGRTEKINEAINRSWTRALASWTSFRPILASLAPDSPAMGDTRRRWLLPLFQELGFGLLQRSPKPDRGPPALSVSHHWNAVPIHLVGAGVPLDRRTPGVAGAAKASPHGLLQDFLNRTEENLWGFVSNGRLLRILRDNRTLTRQAYVEFDLEAILEGQQYSDFTVLWLLAHVSRVRSPKPSECWLERWFQVSRQEGVRALDRLRDGVEKAIEALGSGLLKHRANTALHEALQSGTLEAQELYRQLLRLVYRLIFLFVAEDRGVLLDPGASREARDRYTEHYATARIRRLALTRRGGHHSDLWQGLRIVLDALHRGEPRLALPALGSQLWDPATTPCLRDTHLSNEALLDALRHLSSTEVDRMLRPVNWQTVGAEELGSVYESLLEQHPKIHREAGEFELDTAAGHDRKTTGSYYTPSSLVDCLLDSALDPVIDEAARKPDPERALLELKVCDPACGSGHFLVAAGRRIAHRLAAVRSGEDEPSPEAVRGALRDVVGRCLFGVDLNPMAVELCKVSLWMEALEPGKPLSFLDGHILQGNALVGATPELLEKGVPDDAFKPVEGDDKKVAAALRKRNKAERKDDYDLLPPDASGGPPAEDLASAAGTIERAGDSTLEEVLAKASRYEDFLASPAYRHQKQVADAWCASFFWKKVPEAPDPPAERVFDRLKRGRMALAAETAAEVARLAKENSFFHWHLAFPTVFTGDHPGFDAVLGNPPWERVKLQEKEWFAVRAPDVAGQPNAAARRRAIERLEVDSPALHREFLAARRAAECASHFIRVSGRFPLCGRGDVNTYSVFAETNRDVINTRGRAGFIVPSGIATDDTTKCYFQDLIETESLVSFFEFENRGFFSAGHGHMLRFALMTLSGEQSSGVQTRFFFRGSDIRELEEENRSFFLSANDISLLNPNTRTCPIFRTSRDAELTKAIYRRVPVLVNENDPGGNPWGISFMTMFHMSNDSGLFRTREQLEGEGWRLEGNIFTRGGGGGAEASDPATGRYLPLYEAKMIHHFNHRFGDYGMLETGEWGHVLPSVPEERLSDPNYVVLPRYWVPEAEVEARLAGRWDRPWLLGWRDVTDARASARTVIASLLPRVGVGNKIPLMLPSLGSAAQHGCLLANLSSFAYDFAARQKVGGTTLNYFIYKQLPVLKPQSYSPVAPWDASTTLGAWISGRVSCLSCYSADSRGYSEDLKAAGLPSTWNMDARARTRAELDAAFFHLYGIERDDVDYIMDTFPIVRRNDEKAHGEYRTKRLILEAYDAMQHAIDTGIPYTSPFDALQVLSDTTAIDVHGEPPKKQDTRATNE